MAERFVRWPFRWSARSSGGNNRPSALEPKSGEPLSGAGRGFREAIPRYDLNARDTAALVKGVEVLARIFFAAGAREVYPPLAGLPVSATMA